MKIKAKTKGIIKKVSLALAGVIAISAIGVGVAKLVEYTKEDLKTITPSFSVGNLGSDGKYVNDESTLYTKEAFQCDGLQIKLDFDNEIEYQIYFYDDLDNFVESTEVLSSAYSETVHDGYARIVIMPTNDEDGKIGLTERLTYPDQMTVKVAKEQNVEYVNVLNKRLRIVDDFSDVRFKLGSLDYDTVSGLLYFGYGNDNSAVTSMDLFSVKDINSVYFDYSFDNFTAHLCVAEFEYKEGNLTYLKHSFETENYVLNEKTTHVVFSYYFTNSGDTTIVDLPDGVLEHSINYFVFE